MVLGLAAIVVCPIATLTFLLVIACVLLISGVLGLFTTFQTRGVPGFWWSLLSSVIAMVAGVLLIAHPFRGALSLTFVLVVFLFAEGVLSVMFAIDHGKALPGTWGWMLTSGIIDLVLATIIFAGLPGTAAWAVGFILGINFAFGGLAMVLMALEARRIELSEAA